MNDELRHHGILGQKWGVRRYQNPDGTLTDAGRRHVSPSKKAKEYQKKMNKLQKDEATLVLAMHINRRNSEKLRLKSQVTNNKRSQKYAKEADILDKKMDDLKSRYTANRKHIDKLKTQLSKDNDVVYSVKESNYPALVKYAKLNKELRKKYGGSKKYSHDKTQKNVSLLYGIPTFKTTSMSGSKYDVKPSGKYKNNARYNNDRMKQEKKHTYNVTKYY